MTKSLVIVGAGGFGREVLDVVAAINDTSVVPLWHVAGVVDDTPSESNLDLLQRRGIRFLGTTEEGIKDVSATHYVVGVGSPAARERIAEKFDAAGLQAATLVHPATTTGFDVTMGSGSVICAGVRITTNVHLGRHVHLNLNVTVGHDTTLGDYVSVNPLASVSGDCVVERGVLVGVAGVILNKVRVGAGATVGGSACVVKDVPPRATVKGIPAR